MEEPLVVKEATFLKGWPGTDGHGRKFLVRDVVLPDVDSRVAQLVPELVPDVPHRDQEQGQAEYYNKGHGTPINNFSPVGLFHWCNMMNLCK